MIHRKGFTLFNITNLTELVILISYSFALNHKVKSPTTSY